MRAPLEVAEARLRVIGRKVKTQMPNGWGFVLCMASFDEGGPDGRMTYLSSVQRADAVNLLRELADKLERQEPHL